MNRKLISFSVLIIIIILLFQFISANNGCILRNRRLFDYSKNELLHMYNYYMRNETIPSDELYQQMLHSEMIIGNYNNLINKTIFTKNINEAVNRLYETIVKVAGSKYIISTGKEEQFFEEIFQLHNYMQNIYDNSKIDISDQELKDIIEKLNKIQSNFSGINGSQ